MLCKERKGRATRIFVSVSECATRRVRWINKLVPAFPTAALRKVREERGSHFVADASEFKAEPPAATSGSRFSYPAH